MDRILRAEDFADRDTARLARDLLGKRLVVDGRSFAISETEAYDGPEDKASHASRGQTARNTPMFGPPGRWYVYLCYGVHEMLNLVTGPEGYPAAILIRAVEGVSGPGRLTKRLGIDRRFNGLAAAKDIDLHIVDTGDLYPDSEVAATPRIGVDYAGPDWVGRLYRFVAK